MIGPRIGIKAGMRGGLAVGLGADPISSGAAAIPGVPLDGGVYFPYTAAHWAAILAAAGDAGDGPDAGFAMDEASGNLIDSIGSYDLVAAGAAAAYQQAISGHDRTGVTFTEASTSRFSVTIPNAATSSALALFYVALTGTPSTTMRVVEHPTIYAEVIGAPAYRANGGSAVAGTANPGLAMRPVWVRSDLGSSELVVYTDQEKIASAFAVFAGTVLTLGGSDTNSAGMTVGLGALFFGAAAERSEAQIRTLTQTLGFSVGW